MELDSQIIVDLNRLIQDKKYEYNDLKDGTGVIVSIETGKIITLNGLGNQVISEVTADASDADPQDLVVKIAESESQKHGVAVDTVKADIVSFLQNLSESISGH